MKHHIKVTSRPKQATQTLKTSKAAFEQRYVGRKQQNLNGSK
jgi:hypothetical protein